MKNIIEMARSRARKRGDEGLGVIDLMVSVVGFLLLTAMGAASLTGLLGMTAVTACQADGITIQTAMETFAAANGPSVAITQANLLPATPGGNTAPTGIIGGPYLTTWPSNAGHYTYSILADTTVTPATYTEQITVAPATAAVNYVGNSSCSNVH